MAENPDLLTHLRDFLIAESIVRDPRTAGTDPPFWRNPPGAIGSGEKSGTERDAGVVVSAFLTDGVVPPPTDAPHLRRDVVTIRVRTAAGPGTGITAWGSKAALDFDWRLRAALVGDAFGKREGWTMAGLELVSTELWRALGLVTAGDEGFDYSTGYIFTLYA